MANTSDSEDFESADEDFAEEKPSVVPSLKDNCQKELSRLNAASTNSKSPLVEAKPSKAIVDTNVVSALVPGDGNLNDPTATATESSATELSRDKRKQKQKPREPKPQAKLGKRINPSPPELPPIVNQLQAEDSEEEIDPDPFAQFKGYSVPPNVETEPEGNDDKKPITDDQTASQKLETQIKTAESSSEIDPYAKFRGYSQPPLMERCWETDDDGKPILDDQPAKTSTDSEDKVVADDPYAKLRGFSKPPLMQRCWVTDPNGKPILDDHVAKVETLDAVEQPQVKDSPAECEDDGEEADADPFAMFRGYAVEPEAETGWEDDVDDVEIDSDKSDKDESDDEQPVASPGIRQETQAAKTVPAPTAPEAAPAAAATGFGWGGWGVSSLLATATESVASITSQVSSALEAGIGAPDPTELARRDRLEERLLSELAAGEPGPAGEQGAAAATPGGQGEASGMFGFVSSFTRLVETTGTKVLTGGLDTLESIGKKTMEVLQEGDPGLKKKRAMFTDKTVLSQILREAKVKAEVEDKEAEVKKAERAVHFETLFDDFQGLVHLEALEMLSKQCELKLQALALASSGPTLAALQRRLKDVRESCQLPDEEEEEDGEEEAEAGRWIQALADAEKQLGVPIAVGKLEEIVREADDWVLELDADGAGAGHSAHAHAVATLARLTAASAEQFHKTAEMLLVKELRDAPAEAHALVDITSVLCGQVSASATRYCEALSRAGPPQANDINPAITSIFLEASNSSSYIQEAFQLLIPVLQVGSAF